ncbi:MAG: phosphatase PAP2 family protein [Desulfobulbaceae bacterium]
MEKLARRQWHRLGWPAALLLLSTLLVWLLDGELLLARALYGKGGVWPGIGRFPWNFLYDYAWVPAFLLTGMAAGLLIGGLFVTNLKAQKRQALFLLIMLALGPGLLVNTVLKDHLGRARPRELHEFGGQYPFTQIWEQGTSGKNSSFPSGHAAVAFYLMAPWFILRSRKRIQASCWLAGGLTYGCLVGTARIMQGGHFLLDVIWAGGLVFLSGEIIAQTISLDRLFPRARINGHNMLDPNLPARVPLYPAANLFRSVDLLLTTLSQQPTGQGGDQYIKNSSKS